MDQKLRCQLNRISSKEVQVRRLYEGSRLAYIFFRNMRTQASSPLCSWLFSLVFMGCLPSSLLLAELKMTIDYSLDRSGFFSDHHGEEKKAALEAAAQAWGAFIVDSLGPVVPLEGASYYDIHGFDPETAEWVPLERNPFIARNTLRIYVGARFLPGALLGLGGPGGYSMSYNRGNILQVTQNLNRGQSGITEPNRPTRLAEPTDVAPWGGTISFSMDSDFHWDHTQPVASGKPDFYSVCLHELGHVLGVGTSGSWERLVATGTYSGQHVLNYAADQGMLDQLELTEDLSHWVDGAEFPLAGKQGANELVMDTSSTYGFREDLTVLDLMVLKDMGWEVVTTSNHAWVAIPMQLQAKADGMLSFQFPTQAGRSYAIWQSSDLEDWSVVHAMVGTGAPVAWQGEMTAHRLFFRAMQR